MQVVVSVHRTRTADHTGVGGEKPAIKHRALLPAKRWKIVQSRHSSQETCVKMTRGFMKLVHPRTKMSRVEFERCFRLSYSSGRWRRCSVRLFGHLMPVARSPSPERHVLPLTSTSPSGTAKPSRRRSGQAPPGRDSLILTAATRSYGFEQVCL